MIKKITVKTTTLCLLIALLSLSPFVFIGRSQGLYPWEDWTQEFQKYGPRVYDLIFKWLDPCQTLWTSRQDYIDGDYDIVDVPLEMEGEKNFVVEKHWESKIVQIDINNLAWPTSDLAFRKALSYVANKDGWCAQLLDGWGHILDTPMHPALEDYVNPNVPTYPWNLEEAKRILNDAGFRDNDDDGIREYWNSTSQTWVELVPLGIHWIWRPYHRIPGDLAIIALMLAGDLEYIGIPVQLLGYTAINPMRVGSVFLDLPPGVACGGYHLFVHEMTIDGRTPDYLYSLYHSQFMTSVGWSGWNWIFFNNQSYDESADTLVFASTLEEAKDAAFECQRILMDQAAIIPVYVRILETSHRQFYAAHPGEEKYEGKEWMHAINLGSWEWDVGTTSSGGFNNYWTFLNMHVGAYEREGVIRYGSERFYDILNPLTATQTIEWEILNLIYEPLIRSNPYNMSQNVGWMASNWETGTWSGGTRSWVRFYLIPGILWQDGEPMTAEDVSFTINYLKDAGCAYDLNVEFVDFVASDTHYGIEQVSVYFNRLTPWALQWIGDLPIIPKHIWSNVNDPASYNPEPDDAVIGTGPFRFYKDGVVGRVDKVFNEYVYLEANPLYFRQFIWCDVCDETHTPGVLDGWVDIDDFAEVAKPDNLFEGENPDGTWDIAWGEYCDVNKDGHIGVDDLGTLACRWNGPWPPPWYVDPSQSGTQSSIGSFSQANSAEQESLLRETDSPNNAYCEASLAISADPQVSVCPAIIAAAPGKTFTVDITVSSVTNLYGWEFRISFDPTVLTAVKVTEGPLLKAAGNTLWFTKIKNYAGTVAAGDLLWPLPSQGATGSGTLATVTFYVESDGATSLNFSYTKLCTAIHSNIVRIGHDATDGYVATTIQTAVDWASTTDTVYVTEGTYHEHVTVDKSLTLIGENVETTIIDGNGTNDVVHILANNTNISGFTITNGTVGIHLQNSFSNTINRNLVSSNDRGIYLDYSDKTNIIENNISTNTIGIRLRFSNNNTIYHNNFLNNTESQALSTQSLNTWDNGGEGNHWSDYTGEDQNGDGIGDTPHVIDKDNQDNYPLMEPWSP